MPLPLLLIGAAGLMGGVGVTKMVGAIGDMNTANTIAKEAKDRLDEAGQRLRTAGDETNLRLADLGKAKLVASSNTLKRVVAVADRVHVGEDQMQLATVRGISFTPETVEEMKKASFRAQDILGASAAGLTTGAMAGVGALGLAVTIGTASTGTAIGTLSGAAATNATLAWLGGGALSAGGAGIAGGMAVVSGVIAGPALAIMGLAAARKAEKAKTDATAYAAEVDVAVEKIVTAIFKTRAIDTRAKQIQMVIEKLEQRLQPFLASAEAMLDAKPPGKVAFAGLAEHERALYKTTLAMGSALYQTIEVDVIDELGEVTAESMKILQSADELMGSYETKTA